MNEILVHIMTTAISGCLVTLFGSVAKLKFTSYIYKKMKH
ncbi:type I toxin-antitoxin system Fst family toxin [Staphylococcus caprae]|nr:type I toxin-antitoxin system Fst family toxin [Staphylococcus caprae]MDI9232145.1 type I toxin-antitoxin system Fst family toxin [Staphylococcus caprae]